MLGTKCNFIHFVFVMEILRTLTFGAFKSNYHGFREFSTRLPGLLGDITVLDMTRVIAGPYCTMLLGDLGANVIKVESHDGDESRKWGPPFMKADNTESYYSLCVNRSKRSVCVDFKKPEGEILRFYGLFCTFQGDSN